MARHLAALAALASLSTVACAAHHGESVDAESQALAEDGSDTNRTESDGEAMVTSLLSAASSVDVTASAFYQPAGCLQVTKDDARKTATYVFDHCTGPLGLVAITGEVDVTWATDNGAFELSIASTGLAIGRARVDQWSASATLSTSGADRTLAWYAKLSGTTRRRRPFTRENQKTITWRIGGSCVHVDGTSEGEVASREVRTVVAGFERCGSCPVAGTITVIGPSSGKTVSLELDGSDEATFTASNGVHTSVTLDCTP